MTTQNKPVKNNLIAIGIVALILCLVAVCCFATTSYLFPSPPHTTEQYMKEYGGNPDVYNRILTNGDCGSLQAEFNQAATNLELHEPGTPQYKWSVGYMAAANQRMKELNCNK